MALPSTQQIRAENVLPALKMIGPPGSIGFLALCCAAGLFVIHVWPRRPRAGRAWLGLVFSSYLVLGTPALAHWIADALPPSEPIGSTPPQADLLVVFGGDNARGRVNEAIRMSAAWPSARVVVLGDDWLVGRLMEANLAAGRIVQDTGPGTTLEQMQWVARYSALHPSLSVAIVASRLQMPRIVMFNQRLGLQAIRLPSPLDSEPPRAGLRRWIPTYSGLRLTRDSLYEHAALIYYRSAAGRVA